MTEKEFKLKKLRGEWNCKTGWEPTESLGGAMKFYREEDIKEFIRLLKEFMQGNCEEEPVIINRFGMRRYPIRELDKLAGYKK